MEENNQPKTLTVVIPALNEEKGIGPVIREVPIEKLKQIVYKQQQQIEFLYRELKSIKEQASSSGGGGSGSLKDEIPPHY